MLMGSGHHEYPSLKCDRNHINAGVWIVLIGVDEFIDGNSWSFHQEIDQISFLLEFRVHSDHF